MLNFSWISILIKSFENCVLYSPSTTTDPSSSLRTPLYLMPVWLPLQKFLVKVISRSLIRPSQVNSLSWLSLCPRLDKVARSLPLPVRAYPSISSLSSSSSSTFCRNSVLPKLMGASYQPENWSPTFNWIRSGNASNATWHQSAAKIYLQLAHEWSIQSSWLIHDVHGLGFLPMLGRLVVDQ